MKIFFSLLTIVVVGAGIAGLTAALVVSGIGLLILAFGVGYAIAGGRARQAP